jgi:acyl transferase domain-containing protein/acyl carrier protein
MDQLAERLKNMTPLQRAVFALKETQARLDALERAKSEPIAIVGMACRFPGGANDPASYWRLLCEGVDAIGPIPPDRWNAEDFYDPDPAAPGKTCTRCGGFLERIDEFDNHFFAISDREAARIDPQHRILLELGWEALEDAGLPPSKLRGANIGVFMGISLSDYGMMLSSDLAQTDAHSATGTSLCLAANRLSFAFGFQGPSLVLDTACSSSLVAVHLACQHIRHGECEAALAGGVSLLLSPISSINLTKAGFCSSDGRVRAFDAAASGYVRSEGAGIVVLKTLSAALNSGDPIYAVIRGSAVNQNGASNGLTAPSRAAQEQVLREAYSRAKVSPGLVQFVETQGTGTPLGDAIEAAALGSVLREGRPPENRCAIGAVKTNIGHLEAASGMASLMKAALALKHRQVPPNLHFQTPNPEIPFGTLPLQVPCRLEPWPDSAHARWAGVNAFGFGGSNSHVVLEEPPAVAVAASTVGRHLLPLSARTDKALDDLTVRYDEFLRNNPPAWADVCFTAAARRQHHDCRLVVLADSHEQAADLLASFLNGQSQPNVFAGRKPFGRGWKIAFLYDGRAEAWKAYAPRLAEALPGFAAVTAEIDAALQRALGCSLATVLSEAARWNDPAWARPALLALQLALTAWWRSVGIAPDVVVGQGQGELAAAAAAGILTVDEVLRLVAAAGGDDPRPRPASLPFLSSIDARWHSGPDLNASHWRSCIGQSGDWSAAIEALDDRQLDVCLEIGPASLAESIGRNPAAKGPSALFLPALLLTEPRGVDVLTAVGTLYAAGADPLWDRLAPADGRCVRVPTYPWQRQRLWLHGKTRWAQSLLPAVAPSPDVSQPQSPAPAPATPAAICRPELAVPYVAPRTALEQAMSQSWSAILHIDGIGVFDNFFELGGDSLQATILLNRLQEHLGDAIPSHVLFQVQNINDLADYLRQHCAGAIRRQYPLEVVAGVEQPSAETTAPADGDGKAGAIPRVARDQQADELLSRLDELDDDEVEALLGKTMTYDEVNHE